MGSGCGVRVPHGDKPSCACELVRLDTELSLLRALLPPRCCLFWCSPCHGEAAVSPELGEAAARVGSGQCRPEPQRAQRCTACSETACSPSTAQSFLGLP